MKEKILARLHYLRTERRSLLVVCCMTALLAMAYAGFLAGRTMPPTEGWYTYYAYLINEEGAIPYLDFELLFPPLYVYVIALFTKIFGYGILALRVLGVLIFGATATFACLIFEKLTSRPLLGLLGGLLSVAMLQGEIVQIFYDYIRVMDLFVYASVYFFLRYLHGVRLDRSREETLSPRFNLNVLLGAVFAVLASMCKQSSGLIFLLFCLAFFVFLFICLPHKKELLLQLGVFLGTVAVLYGIMALFLLSQGSLGAYINYNFVSSVDSKGGGSILSILFGWIPRSKAALLQGLKFTLIPLCLLIGWIILSIKLPDRSEPKNPTLIKAFRIGVPTLLLLAVLLPVLFEGYAGFISRFMSPVPMFVVFLFSTVFFVAGGFGVIFRKFIPRVDWHRHYKYVFLSGVIFVLAYSVCTSGGLAESQTALGYAFLPILLMVAASYRKKEIAAIALCLLMVFQTSVAFGRKIHVTYGWWGLETGSFAEQTETCDVPIFQGLKMSPEYAKMYNDVYRGVTEKTEEGEEIFVFPHMPVLYVATDRPRATETAIQWFDVATDEAVVEDIEVIRQKCPKVMVLCEVSEYVIKEHENSFRNGEESGLHTMQDFLKDFVIEKGYACLSENKISEGYTVTVWCLPN